MYRKDFISIASKNSKGYFLIILAFQMVYAWYCVSCWSWGGGGYTVASVLPTLLPGVSSKNAGRPMDP